MTKAVKKVGHVDGCRDATCIGCTESGALRSILKLERYVPQPHVVDGINYSVIDSAGRAYMGREPGRAVMATPQAPAAVGRVLGLHEEGHAAYTPDVPPNVAASRIGEAYAGVAGAEKFVAICARPGAADLVNVAEDTRVNAKLERNLGIGADLWEPVMAHFARLGHAQGMKQIQESVTECMKARDGLSTLLATLPLRSKPGVDAERTAKKFVGRYYPDSMPTAERAVIIRAVEAQSRLTADSTFEDTLSVAEHMIRCAGELETLWGRSAARERARDDEQGLTIDDERTLDTAITEQMAKPPGSKDKAPKWGTMTIETPERPLRVSTPKYRSRYRATDNGAVFRYPGRLCVDGAVFSTRKRVPGGTVLVDVSGSMSLSDEQVAAIVASAPAATIAIYSGASTTGTLRVVARDGSRMAAESMRDDMNGQNIIDGPALRWLGKQAEPRVWVSDGMVTGHGGGRHPLLTIDAFKIAKSGRIVRVPDAERAVALFRSPARLMEYVRARFRAGDELADGSQG